MNTEPKDLENQLRQEMGNSDFEAAYKSAFAHLTKDRFGDYPTHRVTLIMVQVMLDMQRGGEPNINIYGTPGVPQPEADTMRILEGKKNTVSSSNSDFGDSSGGCCCYIATAVYGDYDAPQVLVLRRYRDERLSKSNIGRVLIKVYYSISPPLAERLKKTKRINNAVRKILDKIVKRLQ